MTLEQLQYFMTVSEYMSFTKAAQRSYISQSTLSRHIANLEESLGVKLFIRNTRSISLTGAGKILLEEGQALMKQVHRIEERIKSYTSGRIGSLTIASAGFYYYPLFNIYHSFCLAYENISFCLKNLNFQTISDSVYEGDVDLGIIFSYERGDLYPDFRSIRLSQECFCALVAEDSPLAERGSISFSEFEQEETIFISDAFGSYFILDDKHVALEEYPNVFVESLETISLMVRAKRGIALIPRPMAHEEPGSKMIGIDGIDHTFYVELIWKAGNSNPALSLFLDLLRSIRSEGSKLIGEIGIE